MTAEYRSVVLHLHNWKREVGKVEIAFEVNREEKFVVRHDEGTENFSGPSARTAIL